VIDTSARVLAHGRQDQLQTVVVTHGDPESAGKGVRNVATLNSVSTAGPSRQFGARNARSLKVGPDCMVRVSWRAGRSSCLP
jgi:hypothetical protein